jgi:hypothetical protein
MVLYKKKDLEQHVRTSFGIGAGVKIPDIIVLGTRPIIVDVTIGEPRAAAYLDGKATFSDALPVGVAGAALAAKLPRSWETDAATADRKAAGKLREYQAKGAFTAGRWREDDFHPFALETGGREGNAANELLRHLARLYEAKVTGEEEKAVLGAIGNRFLSTMRQALSATLHKGLADRVISAHAGTFSRDLAAEADVLDFGEIDLAVNPI